MLLNKQRAEQQEMPFSPSHYILYYINLRFYHQSERFTQNNLHYRLQRHFEQTIITDTSQIAEEIDKAIVYFSEHYNEAINVDAYAKQNHVSTNWFIRNFKMYTGTTPKQFILQKRINNAETLLQNKQYNIKEIAQIIGYDNPLYFSRIFQRTKGISPSEYRKNI